MNIGIPCEIGSDERRVALTPSGVDRLVRFGNTVFVERSAGLAALFTDDEYVARGAGLVYDNEEIYGRADLLLKVGPPTPEECRLLRDGQILMCFLRPAVMTATDFDGLVQKRVSTIALELIEDAEGEAPVLRAISELAGPMSIQVAAHLLQSDSGGRGILLGGAPGIAAATVVVMGAGVVGSTAARAAVGAGAHVVVLDRDVARLRRIERWLGAQVTTMIADEVHRRKATAFADVLIGAARDRGRRTPHLVSEAMVRGMRSGTVVIDLSIDQGGCLETSRPTTVTDPTYRLHDVVHYAVPNMTTNIARTASYVLTNALLPLVLKIAGTGLSRACADDPGLLCGLVTTGGRCVNRQTAERHGLEPAEPREALDDDGGHDGSA